MHAAALAGALCLVCALPAAAETPVPSGYAFDQPERLADQLVWGIAHGVRLLGLACARAGYGDAAEAWIGWQEREAAAIQRYQTRLAQHYFRRDDAQPAAIAAAIGLKAELDIIPEQLAPACASLAEALARPRYDLANRHKEILKQ